MSSRYMTQSYTLTALYQEVISSNLPSQRNQQGQCEEVSQRLLDCWHYRVWWSAGILKVGLGIRAAESKR